MSQARANKLAGRIKHIVAGGLKSLVKDPRLEWVTITDVRVTGDLHDATLFYTVFGGEDALADAAEALEQHRGQLRTEVGRQTGVKFTPTLKFVLDAVPENAHHIDELIAAAHQADAGLEAARAGATPAGEADPYKKPREHDAATETEPGETEPAETESAETGPARPEHG